MLAAVLALLGDVWSREPAAVQAHLALPMGYLGSLLAQLWFALCQPAVLKLGSPAFLLPPWAAEA